MQCCKDSGVKNSCLGICTFNLDLDFLLFDSECIPEFDKAMACGSGNFQINSMEDGVVYCISLNNVQGHY